MSRNLLVVFALVGVLSAVAITHAGAATQTTSDVTLIADPSVVVGTSTLTRTDRGISFTLRTSGLESGHVLGQDGTATFAGYLSVGDSDGYAMGTDTTLEDALQATVYLVVRDHGPANPRTVNAQIHTFGVCNTSCTDLQMSVHQPN